MSKVSEAKEILEALGLPTRQQNEMSALTLLALSSIGPNDSWSKARRHSVTVTKGIMSFVAERYGKIYALNTRETFRRQVIHQFSQAGIVDYNPDDLSLPTNSPKAHYALSEQVVRTIKAYGTRRWNSAIKLFLREQGSLITVYARQRSSRQVPVRVVKGATFNLSPGKHNLLQAAVIESFAPRFAPGARLLYLGDTANKDLFLDQRALRKLGFSVTEHGKLPDIVLYDKKRGWIFLIEAVTSHGPMTPKRVFELEAMFAASDAGRVYVSAFPDLAEFRRHLNTIAWETEVWIAEIPDHMIHFNGDRFLGPH